MSSELQRQYNTYKIGIEEVQAKIQELEDDAEEHRKVLDMLPSLDGDRKCMRMIGAVLVEQKVSEVIPALEETLKGLAKALETLRDDLRLKKTYMEHWKTENKVKVVSA